MGIFIHLNISKSVTKKEWEAVYDETLQLISHLPLAERREINIHGAETICLVKTQAREHDYGWGGKEYGWAADGDMDCMGAAERYFLRKELYTDGAADPLAGDAMLGAFPAYFDYEMNKKYLDNVYELWGAKTQGEPYHIYLLAIACLIENRLGTKAFIYGDITRGQCRKAVEIANKYLENPIEMPDRCYADRLFKRVNDLNLTGKEKLKAFVYFFLGTKDAEFGESLKKSYSREQFDEYWTDQFKGLKIGTFGFDNVVEEYLLWGFDIERLCSYVNFEDEDGKMLYEKFVVTIMDTKLHLKDKNCADPLKIDQEQEEPYGIWTLFAQFGYAGARNKKVDRYIPVEQIKAALKKGLAGQFDAEPIIDEYLEKEALQIEINLKDQEMTEEQIRKAAEQDSAEIFYQITEMKKEALNDIYAEYDINDYKDLIFYEKGNTVYPALAESIGRSRKFMDTALSESYFAELSEKTAEEQLKWLVGQNQYILIRDSDWEKVYTDLASKSVTFARYYPIMRVQATSKNLVYMLTAFMINDDLYIYSKEQADSIVISDDQ